MKIVWILNGCGLVDNSITGGPLRFHEVSARWAKARADFEHLLLTTSGGAGMLHKMGCQFPVDLLPASFILKHEPSKIFRFWSYCVTSLYAWRRRNRLPQADVVVTVSDYFCDIIPALLMKRRYGCKWIAWSYHKETHPAQRPGNRFMNEITWRMQEWSFRKIAKYADSVWVSDSCAGDEIIARLTELGVKPERMYRKKNGVDISFMRTIPDVAKSVDAVMIGIRPNKGMADIVPIWKEVQELRPGSTLCLTGGMVPLDGLLAEIQQAGLEKVVTVVRPEGGWEPPEKYYRRIKEARILFTPSHEEGWGIAVCEALAMGMPVTAYNLPVFKSLFDGTFAGVEFNDYSGFAKKICQILGDQQLYNQMAEHGRQFITRYDWSSIADNELKQLLKIMEAV